MAFLIRRLVSTNKRRYQQDGYDLDLSYITPRVIAMGFPCDGVSRVYRNPVNQVLQLLEDRHTGHYKVYNLCIERGYDADIFGGRVLRVPLYDGQAPPLHLLLEVCRDAAAWLAADPANVVAVHCKAGKGRTGAVVCALLLAMDPQLGPASLEPTLKYWAEGRTRDLKGLTIPSQRRFVDHFHRALLGTPGPPGEALATTAAAAAAASPPYPPQHPPFHLARVPCRTAKLLRLRFRGLPMRLLRDCTASVWWRPTGHYQAHTVCHVQTRAPGGCQGCTPAGALATTASETSSGGITWAVRQADGSGNPAEADLHVDLTSLPPLPPPPPPSQLPYVTQSNKPATPTSNGPFRAPTAAPDEPSPALSPCRQEDGGKDAAPLGPVVAGDIKIQLFQGCLTDPPHDVFKGRVTQFSAWLSTAFLDPRVGVLELGRAELDKLSKPLRRWRGAVSVVLEYELMP